MTDRLHLEPRHREVLEALLREHLPDVEVWACGSRVNGRSHDGSDLDLVLRGPGSKEIPAGNLADFKEALQESNIPFLVEARDWARLPERFHQEIKREHVVLVAIDDRKTTNRNCDTVHTTLGNCAHLVRDPVQPSDVPPDSPYIGLEHIGEGSLHLAGQGTANDVESTKNRFRAGDTLFGKLRPYFRKVARAPFDGICSTDIWVVRPRNGVDQGFVHYCLASQHFVDFVDSRSEGTRMPRANWKCASEYAIKLPPLPEQRAIAHVLGALDDKIELNRRMNETLEAMAQAIFKDWFVDFGPVRAKTEGREPYLPPEIWKLFPDALDDEGKPVGWVFSEIGKEVQVIGGGTPSTREPSYWNGGKHHWATPKDLSKLKSPTLLGTNRKITDAGMSKISSGLLPVGTVLLSSRAPIGYLAIAEVPTAVNQGFIAMVCQKRLSNIFVLFWCHKNLDYIKDISSGSTFAEISKKVFRPIPVLVPAGSALSAFECAVRPLYDRVVANERESESLAQVRDLLLPKLISGQIPLRDSERLVGEIA